MCLGVDKCSSTVVTVCMSYVFVFAVEISCYCVLCRRIMPSKISSMAFCVGSTLLLFVSVLVLLLSVLSVEGLWVLWCLFVQVFQFLLFLCIIQIPCPVLSSGCVMV